jgi:hypothetical protein
MTSKYVAKYAFNGNPAQNQLSFPVNAQIIARDGQDGKPWYWGNYLGKDGWFPPTYVAKMANAPVAVAPVARPMTTAGGGSMQDKMAGANFASSIGTTGHPRQRAAQQQSQQQGNPLLSMNTGTNFGMSGRNGMNQGAAGNRTTQGGMNVNNASQSGWGVAPASGGFQSGQVDPFAGLESTAPTLTPTNANVNPSMNANPSLTNMNQTNNNMASTAMNSGFSATSPTSNANSAGQRLTMNSIQPIVTGAPSNTTQHQSTPKNSIQSSGPSLNAAKSSSKPSGQGVNPFRSGGGMTLTMSSTPQSPAIRATSSMSTSVSQQPTGITDTISSAFANVSIETPTKTKNESGFEATITTTSKEDSSMAAMGLQQDVSQKKLVEEAMAKKAVEEEARTKQEEDRVKKMKEDEWERQVQVERTRRLQQAKATSARGTQNMGAGPLPSPRVDGIGASGSSFSNLPAPSMSTTGVPILHPRSGKSFFDPFAFISDSKGEPIRKFNPVYRVQPFWALLNIESYVRRLPQAPENQSVAAKFDQLAKAMSFMCHIVQENEKTSCVKNGMDAPLSFLKANQLAMEACIKMISSLPHSAGASGKQLDQLFLNFINAFVSLITHVQPHQQLVLPGGWQQPEGKAHLCLYIVRNCGDDKFSFTVCNTGDGLEYHPSSFDQSSGLQLKQIALTIWEIPSVRLLDSSFWVLLFRMQVYPDKKHTASLLYEKLLPALNSRPLKSNLDLGPAEFLEVPDAISCANYHFLAKLALTTIPAPGALPSKYNSLLVMNAAVDLAYRNIENAPPGSMDPEDTRILKLTGRNLASYASTLTSDQVVDEILGPTLSSTWDLLDRVLKKIQYSSSKPMDQHSHGMSTAALTDNFSKGIVSTMKVDPGATCFPFFGRFRRDNYENVVKELVGEQRPDPILIPAVLTDEKMPPVATDFQSATSSLQRICHACSLLLHQVELVKNAPAFVASAAQHALTVTLPMPNLDPKHCFWRKNPMRRETQINLLFLIRRMCRIYSTATTCVQQSRGLVAIRTTAFACAACIADAISRITAVDDPSPFALHFSGACEGPTAPFSVEAGSFETLAANMPIFDAHFTSLRCLCLDYLRGNSSKMDGTKRPTIFNFDKSLIPTKGDLILIDQLSIQLALPRPYPRTEKSLTSNASSLISGKNGILLEVLPEMEYFRDIIFHFKHSVSGKAAAPTDVGKNFTWLPHHATLKWTTRPLSSEDNTPMYSITAFRNTSQEFVQVDENPTSKSAFSSFMRFFGKGKEEQRKLSAADPTNIVNSCGEKFLKSK